MRESEHAAPSTIRRRLAALSSLFKHLVRHGEAARSPVAEIERPTINRDEGTTLAFAKAQARTMLAAIPEEEIWLQSQKSARTRRAYRRDVAHFLRTLAIAIPAELRQVDHKAVTPPSWWQHITPNVTQQKGKGRQARRPHRPCHEAMHDLVRCHAAAALQQKTSPHDSTQPCARLADGGLHENAAHFMIAGLGAGVPAL
jgi:site-specific recombinase XerD